MYPDGEYDLAGLQWVRREVGHHRRQQLYPETWCWAWRPAGAPNGFHWYVKFYPCQRGQARPDGQSLEDAVMAHPHFVKPVWRRWPNTASTSKAGPSPAAVCENIPGCCAPAWRLICIATPEHAALFGWLQTNGNVDDQYRVQLRHWHGGDCVSRQSRCHRATCRAR